MDKEGCILTLGIESSCDETSVSVVADGRIVLSNIISSQIEIHKSFGGVVPEIASRKHVEAIIWVIKAALEIANVSLEEVDQIGVTFGPGLIGALLVGLSAAKTLAYTLSKPLIPVHHIEGHISANFIEYPETPAAIMPAITGTQSTDSGSDTISFTPSTAEPSITGIDIKNANRIDDSFSRPIIRPALVVLPEREIPGITAIPCITPITAASP